MKTKMKTTLLLLLFPPLLFLVAHAGDQGKDSDLKCSQRTEAELGKDVTLDCYCEPRCHVTLSEELKWKFNQKTTVLLYLGTSGLVYQDDQFNDRAHVTNSERLKDGNIPLTISTVRKSDEGTYTCHVGRKTCSVELQLKVKKGAEEDKKTPAGAREDNTTPTSGGLNIGARIGTVVVAGVLVLIAVIALVTWKFHEKCKSLLSFKGTQKKTAPPQEDHEAIIPLQVF